MEKFMKIPWYIPVLGLLIGFGMIVFVAFFPNVTVLLAGIAVLHIFGWILMVRFFLAGVGFFSWALNPK